MLQTIAAALVALWLLGLMAGDAMSSFIHILFAAAIVLLVVSINREVSIYKDLKEVLRAGRYNKVKMEGSLGGNELS